METLAQEKDTQENAWFSDWFDSPYYHILYKNRDYTEAQFFIDNLSSYLEINTQHKILDLACGRGRHSIYLNKKGFKVVGADLSKSSINFAKQFENERLNFQVHDMRETLEECCFDFILNLFTSFGYFESDEENLKVIKSAKVNLKESGFFVIDFLNPQKVIDSIVPFEEKVLNEISFKIRKRFENGYIVKDINFEAESREFHFQEKVQAISKERFLSYFEKAKLKLIDIFGDYQLQKFDEKTSDRMIFILKNV